MIPLEITHDSPSRGPQLKDTRLNLYTIIPHRLAGLPSEEIASHFRVPYPDLTADHIDLLFRYMDEHFHEIMAIHWKIQAEIDRGNPPEVEERLRQGRAGFLARLPPHLREKTAAILDRPPEQGWPGPVPYVPDQPPAVAGPPRPPVPFVPVEHPVGG